MKDKKFVFLEHTADAKFQAFGRTLEEAFKNAALALTSLMWDSGPIAFNETVSVSITGSDLKQLLVDFLEEILYLLDTRMFLLKEVEGMKIIRSNGHYELTCRFIGDIQSDEYPIFGEVKAVTYDEMMIKEEENVTLQVVVDL